MIFCSGTIWNYDSTDQRNIWLPRPSQSSNSCSIPVVIWQKFGCLAACPPLWLWECCKSPPLVGWEASISKTPQYAETCHGMGGLSLLATAAHRPSPLSTSSWWTFSHPTTLLEGLGFLHPLPTSLPEGLGLVLTPSFYWKAMFPKIESGHQF